jgi:metallophosphoesterase superfamily enzyme
MRPTQPGWRALAPQHPIARIRRWISVMVQRRTFLPTAATMPAFLAMPWPADASQPAIDLPPGQQF